MDQVTETELAAAARAPRVTPADIEANIACEHYFTAEEGVRGAEVRGACEATQAGDPSGEARRWADVPNSLFLLTFCVLVLKNGFTVTGESACASPENFDAEIGRRIARENAIAKVWPFMVYQLKEQLFRASTRLEA